MSKILVITGLGYYEDGAGHVVAKAQLPPGSHDLTDGLTYIEVNSQAELDAVQIYQDPADILQRENENKIRAKIRTAAIEALIAAGDLPPDYEDPAK